MKKPIKLGVFSQFEAPISNITPAGALDLAGVFNLIKNDDFKSATEDLRCIADPKEKSKWKKSKFPYVCFSGTFAKRSNDDLLSYSGLLTLDLDDLNNVETVVMQLSHDKLLDLRLLFRSPSGNGLKAIIQTNGKVEDHLSYFNAYSNYLKRNYQLVVDKSGKDLARACFLCHDPQAQSNDLTEEISFPMLEWLEIKSLKSPPKSSYREYVNAAVQLIKNQNIDITANYQDWITLGFALADEFGEDGRALFHEFSSMNTEYNSSEADEKYSSLIQSEGSGVTIKSLWHLMHKNNVNVELPNEPSEYSSKKLQKVEKWLNDRYCFRYNQLRSTIEVKVIDSESWKLINDRIFNSILIELKRSGIPCSSDLLNSLLNSDFIETHHPFKEYLSSLPPWDGEDHIGELAKLLKVDNETFWMISIRKWIVALVATVLDPKAINQQVIVLCGPQGIGKTTFILNMIPEELQEYIFTGTINPGNKDSIAMLAEMIVINLDEMDNMNRSDSGTLKSLITMRQVTLRKAYGRFNETRPRIASFIGSVNDRQFLNDPTGSRRFLVIDVLEIDYLSKINIGQVYQQGVHLYESEFKYYFEPKEVKMIEENNACYQKTSIEEDLLLKYFEPISWNEADDFRTATEILQHFNSYSSINLSQNHANQVGKVLAKQGFEKGKKDGVYKWAVKVKF